MFYPKKIFSGIFRLWILIASTQISLIVLAYIFFGQNAFFLLGPFFLYDIAIYTYCYWYPPLITKSLYKGTEFQNSLNILKQSFNKLKRARPELLMMDTEYDNILTFAHRNRIWVITSKNFLDGLSSDDQKIIFGELALLHKAERLTVATTLSALFFTMPFLPVKKGTELNFFSENENENWLYLTYKTFHRQSLRHKESQSHLLPCLFFPALPNYGADSYFSLYTFLRERLIKSMKPAALDNLAETPAQGEL
jgi:hypothetical protein